MSARFERVSDTTAAASGKLSSLAQKAKQVRIRKPDAVLAERGRLVASLGAMASDRRRTKIVATIGPVTSTHDAVRALVDAGVDAIRLNLSHGVHADHEARANVVREVQAETGKPLALIADLQGPKLRIGDLDSPAIENLEGSAVV